jgi:periplasmic protein TonB
MEIKKNPKIDVERNKFVFLLTGLLVTQLLVLAAFSYTEYEERIEVIKKVFVEEAMEEVPPTEQVFELPPPPPTIVIAETDDDTEEDVEIPDTDFDDKTVVAPPPPPPPPPGGGQKDDRIFESVEIQPEYPGGQDAMYAYIGKNFKYPDEARRFEIEGRVIISFVVDEEGGISDVKAVMPEARQLGYGLEQEAIRVVKGMPRWKPGRQLNRAVKVRYTLPIQCSLN